MAERTQRQAAVSFRLDEQTKRLLDLLAAKTGQSRTSILIAAIRREAKREGVG